MKKTLFLFVSLSLLLGACLPVFPQTQAATPTPVSQAELEVTAAVLAGQTLQALPTETVILPSETPVILTPTQTTVPETPTETPNPILLTLTATLGTGTPFTDGSTPGTAVIVGTLPFTGTPGIVIDPRTPTRTPRPLFHGTLPPSVPYGKVTLVNQAKADAYISLRCVTPEGYVTYLEYPVKQSVSSKAPAGTYTYVAWIGGRQFTGSFSLKKDGELTINLFKDKITIIDENQ